MKTNIRTITPRIYVACLASYNAGELHGEWIDADQSEDAIYTEIKAILNASPQGEEAEEWAIHDYEGFSNINIREYESIQTVAEIGCFIGTHGELGAQLISYCDNDIERAQKAIDDNYCGEYSSIADFAESLTEDTHGNIPPHLANYIDYERMGQDMELSGDIFVIEIGYNEVHIFWNF